MKTAVFKLNGRSWNSLTESEKILIHNARAVSRADDYFIDITNHGYRPDEPLNNINDDGVVLVTRDHPLNANK